MAFPTLLMMSQFWNGSIESSCRKGCAAIQFFGDNDSETVETACIILYMEKVLRCQTSDIRTTVATDDCFLLNICSKKQILPRIFYYLRTAKIPLPFHSCTIFQSFSYKLRTILSLIFPISFPC